VAFDFGDDEGAGVGFDALEEDRADPPALPERSLLFGDFEGGLTDAGGVKMGSGGFHAFLILKESWPR